MARGPATAIPGVAEREYRERGAVEKRHGPTRRRAERPGHPSLPGWRLLGSLVRANKEWFS